MAHRHLFSGPTKTDAINAAEERTRKAELRTAVSEMLKEREDLRAQLDALTSRHPSLASARFTYVYFSWTTVRRHDDVQTTLL